MVFVILASYYSENSLKNEGTWERTKGVCANGKQFDEQAFTAASCDYELGQWVRVTNTANGRNVVVKITDRINKRFKGKRIDLSKMAFSRIGKLEKGLVEVKVEEL